MAEFHYEVRGHKCRDCDTVHPKKWFCIQARDFNEVRSLLKDYGKGSQWRRLPRYRHGVGIHQKDKWKEGAP